MGFPRILLLRLDILEGFIRLTLFYEYINYENQQIIYLV